MSIATAAMPGRPTIKRSLSDLEENTPQSSQSPLKKPKVQFGDNKVFTLKSWNDDKPISLLKEEVERALKKHAIGESTQYDGIREILLLKPNHKDAPSPELLKRYMIALSSHVGLFGRRSGTLVDAITEMYWVGRDKDFLALFQSLLASLVSVYGGYGHDILSSLVEMFMSLKPKSGMLPGHEAVTQKDMLDRVHATISHIIHKAPSAVNTLKAVLQDSYPHASDSLKEHFDYAANILRIAESERQIRADIIALIVSKLAAIDVQTQTDLDDLQEYGATLDLDMMADVRKLVREKHLVKQDNSDFSDSEDESDIDEVDDPEQQRLQLITKELAKMDAVMDLLFSYYANIFDKAGPTKQEENLDQLIGMFTRSVLPTYRSRHIQFLLFHFSQKSEDLSERFIEALMDYTLRILNPTMTRRSAAAYLASYVARASTVDRDLVQYTFRKLMTECERLRVLHEKHEACGPDLQRFGMYYTLFQCLMYIFCFRWRQLMTDDVDDDDLVISEISWARNVVDVFRQNCFSKLNPLKVCAQGIVNQFSMISHQLQILMLEPILQRNARIKLTRSMFSASGGFSILAERSNASSGDKDEGIQLDAYFPFDPYKLPTSQHWVSKQYNEWRGVPGFDENEYESEDESDVDEEEYDQDLLEYDEPTETESVHSRT